MPKHTNYADVIHRYDDHEFQSHFKKVREVAQKLTVPNINLSKKILHMFRLMFIRGYVQKHKKWPQVKILNGCPKYIIQFQNRNLKIDMKHPKFKLHHLKFVQLIKNFEVDSTLNISAMISDKASSLKKSELIKRYKKFNIGKSSDRRVILEWLKNDIISAEQLMTNIDQNGFDKEDLVIGVVPKERELKQDPLTLFARLYFVVTESLISDHSLQYFPQITVTLSGSEQSKLLL